MIDLEFKVKITPIITFDDEEVAHALLPLFKQLGIAGKVKSYKDEDGRVHLHFD